MELLDRDTVRLLCENPQNTFVPVLRSAGRVRAVALVSIDESQTAVTLSPDSEVSVRPDLLPFGDLTMVTVDPLYLLDQPVGWLVHLPALPIMMGRNFVRVTRRNVLVDERDPPQISLNVQSLLVVETVDVMTLVLATRVKELRV